MMAILLAVIPYFILRWVFERIARWWFARKPRHQRIAAYHTNHDGWAIMTVNRLIRLRPDLGRAVVAAHRHVLPAHAHERRPDADVGDPHPLSLIGFGFTIYQVFESFARRDRHSAAAPANFGIALVLLGIGMLIVGIIYHLQFMARPAAHRDEMTEAGLIHGQSGFPLSFTLIIAVLLLLVGLAAIVSMVFDVGPFG